MKDADVVDTPRILAITAGGLAAIGVGYAIVALLFGARPFADPPMPRAGPVHILSAPLGAGR